jgi:copper chaperone
MFSLHRRDKSRTQHRGGRTAVDVDLETKLVRVSGEALDDAALRAAIEEAGYEAVP